MPYEIEIKDNKATFKVTVPADKVTEAMKDAADNMSEQSNIPGFRPGKASYDVVKQRMGEMKILEAALEGLVRTSFVQAMLDEDLDTVGQPYFNMLQMVPGSDLIYTAEIALHPKITKLADYKKLTVAKKSFEPSEAMVKQAKADLARMRTKEVRAAAGYESKKGDKVVVALGMKKGGVVLEGGESQAHGVYTGEEHYIPGFSDHLVALKEGDKKQFTLDFPNDHYQKHLSGQKVDFDIEVKEIYTLEPPEWNDEFAKSLGLETAANLDTKLTENLRAENESEENLRQDKEMLELLAKESSFEPIPDLLVNQEIEKMLHELKESINGRGLEFEEYLKSINKTLVDLKLDLTPTAIIRVKIAMILKEIANKEKIVADVKEVDLELDKLAEQFKDNEQARDTIYSPQYRDYVERQMTNRKTIAFLKELIVK